MEKTKLAVAISIACLAAPGLASATDGYFSHGYGVMEQGRGGAAFAVADDALGGANNPATMAFVGDRLDVGIHLFSPHREASRTGNTFGLNGTADSGNDYFAVPEFGYNHVLSQDWTLGVSVYANGGMNTQYPGGQLNCGAGPHTGNLLCGSGTLGVDLAQLVVAPTVTYKINSNNSIGLAPLLGIQRFKAEGLQAFTGFSSQPNDVTNKGYNYSYGAGVRIGWMGKVTDTLSLGLVYSSRMSMTKFNRYAGLFAEAGGFDIPQHFGAGLAFQATPDLLLAFDYERINYSEIRSVGNPSTNPPPLGAKNGPGFGWQDVNVFRIGGEYKLNEQWTLRAGYNHSDNPITPRDVTINILAPGVVQDHVTIGASYALTPTSTISAVYWHAFENSVSGATSPLLPGGGRDTIKMHEDLVGIAYGLRF